MRRTAPVEPVELLEPIEPTEPIEPADLWLRSPLRTFSAGPDE